MKLSLKTLLAAFLLVAATGYGQTVKTLGYNTTNGHIIYAGTNTLTFTNAFTFSTNTLAASVRTNLGLGFAALTNANAADFRTAIALPWSGLTNTNASTFRTALDLPWAGLTNTNAATFQAALFPATNAAPTNTNAPTPNAWLDVQVGTNTFKLPLWQ
jgi:hypothetical protein